MKLTVLGSGSRGNCLAIEDGGRMLLVDAGFSAREIERRAEMAGLSLGSVTAIVLTHEHGDHACGAVRLARLLGVGIATSTGTWNALGAPVEVRHYPLTAAGRLELDTFRVECCATSHDAAEPLAVAVQCASGARVGVAHDLGRPSAALRYMLRDATTLVIEANHDEVLLRTSGYPPSVQQRIAGSGGHLSNHAAAELLLELCHRELAHVVLAHLSQHCNSADAARAVVGPALRKARFRGALHLAPQDVPLTSLPVLPPTRMQLGFAF